ncbi:MAG: NapC/NirT family cytochrome c [Ignavibacteriae bacterium]|nr:NapC/NirT family cytochrome c [Ignavibacteriota bacterium]
MRKPKLFCILHFCFSVIIYSQTSTKHGELKYEDFKTPEFCGAACHSDFYQQWKQSMMSKSYTHHWDEIEYFKLAVPHAEKDEKVAEVKDGCNGCHAPISYVAGDTPPPKPEFNSRANEGVSCEVCHSISGFEGDTPYNFNYIMKPGKTKFSGRGNGIQSPAHEISVTDLHRSGDFCGICHNEKSPYGIWVKSTHLEWKEGPYSKEGVQCQDCHMPKGESIIGAMGNKYPDSRQHLFHGAHDPGKVKGTIELRIHPDIEEAEPGETVKFTVVLFNQKTGHKFPTGSVEDRIVWLQVEAFDETGKTYHIPVDKKGFDGEEYTISSDVNAYQDMGIALANPNFEGVKRDDIQIGNRIFRMPYFDPQNRMTIQQWNTASLGVDYRIGPRETKIETFTFNIPDNISEGKLKINAKLYYQKLISSVGKLLNVPSEEYEPLLVNEHFTTINIID